MFGLALVVLRGLACEPAAASPAAPRLAVAVFEYLDTSGEVRDQSAEHQARLRKFRSSLEAHLEAGGTVEVVSLPHCAEEACSTVGATPERLMADAREAGAELLVQGAVHKVSTLIQEMQVTVLDVGEQRVVLQRAISFRGETDQAYERAARFVAGTITAELATVSDSASEVELLIDSLGLEEAGFATRDRPDWRRPERVVVRVDHPGRLEWMQPAAPGVELVPLESDSDLAATMRGADAVIGVCSEEVVAQAAELRWVQVFSAGVENCVSVPSMVGRGILLTNMQRVAGPVMAEHVFALLLGLTRNVPYWVDAQREAQWRRSEAGRASMASLRGKTMLVAGLGGIGTEVARLGHAFGMEVIATRASARDGPDFVKYVGLPHELLTLAKRADVAVNTVPLTPETRGIFDAGFFAALPPGALFINVGRGASVDTPALLAALESGRLAGAGLDVTDPEPLPADHPLWHRKDVIITPHVSAGSDAGREDRWLIARENLRRYVEGEPLLSVVNLERGY